MAIDWSLNQYGILHHIHKYHQDLFLEFQIILPIHLALCEMSPFLFYYS